MYYVNDVPHIGHAYTTLACDVLARFKRLDGFDVMFVTGTDEHGQKVEKSAAAAGMSPQDFCDKVSEHFRELCRAMNCTNDDFVRTTEPRHLKTCQDLWRRLEENGEIYLGKYEGWYSVRDEAFYGESELEKDEAGDLRAPSGASVEWVEEPSYFFRLSAWQDRLLKFYEETPDRVLPKSRKNEVASFVKGELRDLSVSRTSFSWGIPVPGAEGHIMYVWIDALANYLTAAGYPDLDSANYQKFWPADVHVVGKDILRFHAVYWPAFLMAAGLEPPKRVFAHGWWTNEGQKISKSLGNVIDPFQLIEEFGLDPMRYFLMREVPFGNDGDFSRKAFIHRLNGDLANDLGNLAQRVLAMIAKNCDGRVPEPGQLEDRDKALLAGVGAILPEARELMDRQAIDGMLKAIWKGVAQVNGYVSVEEPWVLRKTDPARMNTVLYVAAEAIRWLAILIQPVMPGSMAAMLDQLGVGEDARSFAELGDEHALKPGATLPQPSGIFPRFTGD
ncbi:MAG: methionine--tRNA ligase [Sphingomonadales bacterium]